MTRVTPGFRGVAALGFLILPLLISSSPATAQRPVISSCAASPSIVAPGGTAKIHVQATSPSGLPLHYIFTASTGTVQGDGASATFTAGTSSGGVVTVLCEARDSHDSWVRSRTWVRVVGAATEGAATTKPTPAKPQSRAVEVPAASAKVAQAPHAPPPSTAIHPTPPPEVAAPAPTAAPAPAYSAPLATPVPPPDAVAPAPLAAAPSASTTQSVETAQTSLNNAATNEWVKQSKDGLIEYTVPQKMRVGIASKVTVMIHGHQDKQDVAADATRAGSLTAQYMKVLLLAENPSGLKVVSQGTADIQYVPKDKTATWVWSVTPMGAASNQTLQVRVFEEYKSDTEQDVDAESYLVKVTAPSRLTLAKEAYFGDPDAWWKYWLPSGVVFLVLIWLFLRLIGGRRGMPEGTTQKFDASDWI